MSVYIPGSPAWFAEVTEPGPPTVEALLAEENAREVVERRERDLEWAHQQLKWARKDLAELENKAVSA